MSIKIVLFSGIAVAGSAGLLSAAYSAGDDTQENHYAEQTQQSGIDDEHEQVRALQQRGDILALEKILENARQHHDGRVLETELEEKRGRYIYEVELLDSKGQVWELKFDASSGALLTEEKED